MEKHLLLGAEAVALGAIHGGLNAAYSYPGTPASELMEFLISSKKNFSSLTANWTVNEKVAYEEALGVSYAGQRSLVSMKHVGLNVAADPFMNSAVVSINGGFIVVVADDPGMHSSQNEQDSRYYAQFANILCLEPATHQEAYDMAYQAFDLSEQWHIPIMIRLVTRLAHSRSLITAKEIKTSPAKPIGSRKEWITLPVNARKLFAGLLKTQKELLNYANHSPFNQITVQTNEIGIIATGIAYNYVMEVLQQLNMSVPVLKISTYPPPEEKLNALIDRVKTLLVIEEGYPLIEKKLIGLKGIPGVKIKGKLDETLPASGELSPDIVRQAITGQKPELAYHPDPKLANRPPQLCTGCPHGDTFDALNLALESYPQGVVFSDIGCYTLGALPPYSAIDTCVCMGASVSMAKGAADANIFPSFGLIGDSTFAHSGLTPLLDAVRCNTNMTLIIVDNGSVAMTGGQPTFLSGQALQQLLLGMGVTKEHMRIIVPLPKNKEQNAAVIKEEIKHHGLSVIISLRECIHELKKRNKNQ
jgi:indolepyruvate ferredoxin oxidoreductase alpha subunit